MKEELIYKLADQYFEGNLSEKEKETFDEQLQTDKAFAKQVSEYMVTVYLVRKNAREKKKKQLSALYQQGNNKPVASNESKVNEEPPVMGKIRTLPTWLFAAAAALVAVFAGYWILNREEVSGQQLFAEYKATTYKKVLNEKNRSGAGQFEQSFANKNFTKALSIAKAEYQNSDALLQPIWLERQGFCYLEVADYQNALSTFGQLKRIKEIPIAKNMALWYEALTYLTMEDEQKAKETLKQLVSIEGHVFSKEANELLKKL